MIPTLSRQQAYNKRNKNNNEQISIQKIEKNVIGMYISENRQKKSKKITQILQKNAQNCKKYISTSTKKYSEHT